jgi:hypothetical protein
VLDALGNIGDFVGGIGVALLAMFRSGSVHTWEPRARLAFWLIVTQGFAALFFALLLGDVLALGLGPWVLGILPWLSVAPVHPGAASLAVLSIAGLVFSSPAVHAGIVGVIFLLAVWNLFLLSPLPSAA